MNKEFIIFLLALSCVVGAIFFIAPVHYTASYDCRIAEISPDIPPAVRDECRRINAEKNKQ